MTYEFLQHTADVKFRASGKTLEELFESSALALVDAMLLDVSTVEEREEVELEAEGGDLEELLFSWLDEVVFQISARTRVFDRFDVERLERSSEPLTVSGRGFGEEADLERHEFETEVKAVSYHGMEVRETGEGWEAEVVLDV